MAIVRAQVILPYFTGLPEDVATNTFYFAPVAIVPDDTVLDIIGRLGAAYNALDGLLSPVLSGEAYVKIYDMDDPEPRLPLYDGLLANLTVGSVGYAEEVAGVISFRAAYAAGQPNARRRGRIYVGPLSTTAIAAGDSDQFARMSGSGWSGVLTGFVAGMEGTSPGNGDGGPWCVYSRVDGIARNVVEAWRDDACDVQRRRGAAATTRSTIPVAFP